MLGCASTTVNYPNGTVAMKTQADMTGVTMTGNGMTFHADTITHSIPTLAGGAATSGDINAVAGLAAVAATGVAGGLVAAGGTAVKTAVVAPAVAGVAATGASSLSNPPSKSQSIADAASRPAEAYHAAHSVHATYHRKVIHRNESPPQDGVETGD